MRANYGITSRARATRSSGGPPPLAVHPLARVRWARARTTSVGGGFAVHFNALRTTGTVGTYSGESLSQWNVKIDASHRGERLVTYGRAGRNEN